MTNEIKYYGQVNSHDELKDIASSTYLEDEYGSRDVQNIEVPEEYYLNTQEYGTNYYMYSNGEIVLNPNYEQEEQQKRRDEFEIEFFETSLGWIRRQVTMKDGSQKDFISDLLPNITTAMNNGTPVSIITYTEPDFTEDIVDWTPYQTWKQTTPQFIQECLTQLQNDFIPTN